MIKFLNIQKSNKKNDSQPDYRISFQEGETFIEGGACWKKTDKNGQTFLSCKLGDPWVDHTDPKKSRRGWHVEADRAVKASESPENGDLSDL